MKFFTNEEAEPRSDADLPELAEDLRAWSDILGTQGSVRLEDDCCGSPGGTMEKRTYGDPTVFTCLTLRQQNAGVLRAVLEGDIIKFLWSDASGKGALGSDGQTVGISGFDNEGWEIQGDADKVRLFLEQLCDDAQQAVMQQLEPAQPRMQQETRQPPQRRRRRRNVRADQSFWRIVPHSIDERPSNEREAMQKETQRMGAVLYEMAEQVLKQHPNGHRYPINDSGYKSIEVYPNNGGDTIVVLLWAENEQQTQSLTFDRQTGLMQIVDGETDDVNHESVPFAENAERSEPEIGDLVVYRAMVPLIAQYLEDAKSAEDQKIQLEKAEQSPGGDAPACPDAVSAQERNSRTATCAAFAQDLAASAQTALGDCSNRVIVIAAPSRFAGELLCISKGFDGMSVSIAGYGCVVLDDEMNILEVEEYAARSKHLEKGEAQPGDTVMNLRVLREMNACFMTNADPVLAATPVAQTVQALWEIASMAEGESFKRLPRAVGDFEVMEVEKYGAYHHVRVKDVRGVRVVLCAEFDMNTGFVGLHIDDEENSHRSLDSFPFLAKAIGKEQVGCRDPQFDTYAAQLLALVQSATKPATAVAPEGE